MPASNQYMAAQPNVLRMPAPEVAAFVHARLQRGRGTMVFFVRPDGRVRIMRDEMLEDDTGRGVVGYFTKAHTAQAIQEKLDVFLQNNQVYLGQ